MHLHDLPHCAEVLRERGLHDYCRTRHVSASYKGSVELLGNSIVFVRKMQGDLFARLPVLPVLLMDIIHDTCCCLQVFADAMLKYLRKPSSTAALAAAGAAADGEAGDSGLRRRAV